MSREVDKEVRESDKKPYPKCGVCVLTVVLCMVEHGSGKESRSDQLARTIRVEAVSWQRKWVENIPISGDMRQCALPDDSSQSLANPSNPLDKINCHFAHPITKQNMPEV